MAEDLIIANGTDKSDRYNTLIPQIEALVSGESDLTANLANIAAALKETFSWWWVGFYLVKEEQLVLGPFQGPVACTRIAIGKGVCGASWQQQKSLLIPDVEQFPGHIACSSLSVAEIVVPIFDRNGTVRGVIDVDSERFDILDQTDLYYLEKIAATVTTLLP